MASVDGRLAGTTILLAEQDSFLAGYLRTLLERRGARTSAPAASTAEALARLRDDDGPHAAAVDMRLADGPSWPVADELAARRIPFLFIATFVPVDVPPRLRAVPVISRPCTADDVATTLAELHVAGQVRQAGRGA